ncbi:hypothetical protein MKX03_028159, partial [Papaver bracteatum]
DPHEHLFTINFKYDTQIATDKNNMISSIPTKEEIWNVLKKMGSLKSPGPYGMPPIFYKKCWDKVGNEVTTLIKYCFAASSLPNG